MVTEFIYNKEADTYTCPQGETLTTTGTRMIEQVLQPFNMQHALKQECDRTSLLINKKSHPKILQ
jgi:hypothetical protein